MVIGDTKKSFIDSLEKVIEIVSKMGMRIEEFKKGFVKVRLPKEPNVNHIGIVYAGSLFSLADFAGGVLFTSCFDLKKYYPILKEVTIVFKRPATTDVTVESSLAPGEIETLKKMTDEAGKTDRLIDFELKDEMENVCCVVRGNFQLRKA